MLKKDKAKVIDEVWTEDRVRSFLDLQPITGTNADFHALLKAYQSMRASDFALFIGFFTDAGRDVNATNPDGKTVLAIIRSHAKSAEFQQALNAAGAS